MADEAQQKAPKSAFTLANTAPGNRGFGMSDGTTLALAPGQTSGPVNLTADEAAEAEATGWFKVEAIVEADDANLDAMTVDELKAFAAANSIDLGTATKKADILSAIEAALTAPQA